ncbi:hypothetical protein WA026_003355 [Henosepilachna vigintioctopunctata]|uniref:Uncharacterized protein n=1 Tax=Henosepilachna vigintioctopunctata TaxID=420089 RepID=A0AAW1TR35_9CUCU
MDTLYNSRIHGFPNLSRGGGTIEPALSEQGVLSLVIVFGSSISLVGLVFAFITYRRISIHMLISVDSLFSLWKTKCCFVINFHYLNHITQVW